jgi:hypothetical protein
MNLEWTEAEETAFAEIMRAGQIERLSAIRLLRRFNGNLARALEIARTVYNPRAARREQSPAQIAALAQMQARRREKACTAHRNPDSTKRRAA